MVMNHYPEPEFPTGKDALVKGGSCRSTMSVWEDHQYHIMLETIAGAQKVIQSDRRQTIEDVANIIGFSHDSC